MTDILQTRSFAVGYDGTVIVRNADLRVAPGEIVTLIGPNGAGKSTILKSIAGQLAFLGGAAYLSGKPLESLSPRERALELSVLLTERLRTELLSCADVVESGRYPHTGRLGILSDADRAEVRRAMEAVQVWDLRDRDFMRVSDGQRQRVLLARAICQRPRLLVLDEPASYLHIHYPMELLRVLLRLVRENDLGILMSFHELSLARKVSTRVVCVKNGGIAAAGTPDEVFVPEVIDALFDLEPGSFDPMTGDIRLEVRR
jgi:iron complex transport system ATP-binding protein